MTSYSQSNMSLVEEYTVEADTYGTGVFVNFREVSALERFELKSSQI